jgi:copper resistance protein B
MNLHSRFFSYVPKKVSRRFGVSMLIGLISCLGPRAAGGQTENSQSPGDTVAAMPSMGPPVMDNQVFVHVLFDQLEGRFGGPDSALRWDAQGWIGNDMNRLWIKSEGFLENGAMTDGDQEALYDRPIPHLRYFDAQVGVREDLDSEPSRTWGAVGIEGLAPNFLEVESTFYIRDGGHVAGRLMASYDLLITQHLILQPEMEMNLYSKNDPERRLGTGLSDLDTGIRLRYEITRKFAPYIGFTYARKFGDTATLARQAAGSVSTPAFVFGLRLWY